MLFSKEITFGELGSSLVTNDNFYYVVCLKTLN